MIELIAAAQALPHSVHLASILTPVNGSTIAGAGAGEAHSLGQLQTGLDRICNVIAGVGAGAGVLGIIAGGLMHTQVFHNERAPETGKHIIKNSLYGIGFMAGGPMLLKMALAL
jgi:hypothetical protein